MSSLWTGNAQLGAPLQLALGRLTLWRSAAIEYKTWAELMRRDVTGDTVISLGTIWSASHLRSTIPAIITCQPPVPSPIGAGLGSNPYF